MGLGEHILGENDTHATPAYVLAPLEERFGIDFDPCGNPSNVFARETCMLDGYSKPGKLKTDPPTWIDYRASQIVVPEFAQRVDHRIVWRDGLAADWSGRGFVFVNPPFSDIEPWLIAMQSADEGVMLLPARVNAAYLHTHGFPFASAIFFPDRRVQFIGATTQPPWHTLFLYWGRNPVLFHAAFRHLGLVLPLGNGFSDSMLKGRLLEHAA